jgi:predicted negative regulator of RcsB-dependent stress response
MANYSEARKNANKNWDNKNLDRISIALPKGSKDALKAHAESQGESVNSFIKRAIMEVTEMDNMHRAYQRGLLHHLEKAKAALDSNDLAEAKRILTALIEDTKADI